MNITQKELIELKQEYETLNAKLKDLTQDELKIVTGGAGFIDSEDYIEEEAYEK